MINAKFKLNGKDMSKFEFNGGKFDAFSGMSKHKNKAEHICVVGSGPIPIGTYYIVDRESGGRLGKLKDFWTGKDEWFALYKQDNNIDDIMFCNAVQRGQFRLHPKGVRGISEGCITINKRSDYATIRNQILSSAKFPIPSSEYLTYGIVVVS